MISPSRDNMCPVFSGFGYVGIESIARHRAGMDLQKIDYIRGIPLMCQALDELQI